MKDYRVNITCETLNCINEGEIINYFYCSPFDVDLILEDTKQNEEEDYCKLCGNPGVVQEPYLEE